MCCAHIASLKTIICKSFVCLTSLAAELFCISLSISVLPSFLLLSPPPSLAPLYPLCLIAMPDCSALRVCCHAPPRSPAAPHTAHRTCTCTPSLAASPDRPSVQLCDNNPVVIALYDANFSGQPLPPASMPMFL